MTTILGWLKKEFFLALQVARGAYRLTGIKVTEPRAHFFTVLCAKNTIRSVSYEFATVFIS